ncbi:MAG: HAMP domain-containing histidine kinase [Spirochaetaceae bacterium]
MKARKGSNNTKTTIISIVILDIILMSLFLFFSDSIIKDFQNTNDLSTIVISSFAIVIPGSLVILITIQFYKLFKSKFKPGNNFKKNIIYYFILTISLVIIPQTFISVNFIQASTNNWLNKKVTKSIDVAFNMALEIENKRRIEIEKLSTSNLFLSVLKQSFIEDEISIEDLNSLNSLISSVEFFNITGNSIKYIGNTKSLNDLIKIKKDNYFYPKYLIDNREVLLYQFKIDINNEPIVIIITNKLPKDFSKNGSLLTTVKNSLNKQSSQRKEISFGMLIYYAFFSIPLFLLAILGCFIFSDEIIKPLTDIEEAIEKVAHGNYSYRILSKKKNEFNILISSFNNMIKEVERSRSKLKHTEQISTWQDIATRLAHEIRNPLTPIKLSAQMVLLKENNVDNTNKILTKYMQTIINEVTRMEKLLNEFRDFARFPNLKISRVSILDTINESLNIYKGIYPNIEFDLQAVENIEVEIDKSQMIQVISNLTINSIHALEDNGLIIYSSETVHKKGIKFCRISIKDNGHGIPKEIIPNLFKPYFTTKYNGSGLGLAIVNKIILDHKGKIWIESAEEIGTTFYFEFPKEVL